MAKSHDWLSGRIARVVGVLSGRWWLQTYVNRIYRRMARRRPGTGLCQEYPYIFGA